MTTIEAPLALARMLESAIAVMKPEDASVHDMARTSCRIPRAVLDELAALAQANRMSVSLVINLLIDDYLREQGRPGYSTLARWYPDYALRKKPDTA